MSKKDIKSSKKKSFNNPKDKKDTKTKKIETITANTEQSDKLHEQILSLGGTKGDLKFLENVDLEDVDDEFITSNEDKELAKSLQKELQGFIKNIGLTTELAEKYDEEEDDSIEEEIEENEEEEVEGDDDEEEDEEDEEDEDDEEEEEDEEDDDDDDDEVEKATTQNKKPTKETVQSKKGSNLLVDPTQFWHQTELSPISNTNDIKKKKPSSAELNEKIEYARQLLDTENENSSKSSLLSSSDRTFMSNIMQSGTLQDKVSALTLLIQESPLHALKTLDTIMSMTKKKGRKEANLAIVSLKDLFIGSVLPDRKLIYFADRPLIHPDVTDRHLLLWYFEDYLKKYYFEFIQQIEALSHDPLVYVRYSMVNCLQGLLVGKPEQEQNLLKLLVNKLGDSENKVAAKASQLLIELLVQHPGMKIFVIREIEQLILRPNVSERAQYYSIITLNQTILTTKEGEVANKLIDIYFTFFQRLLKITEDDESKEKEKEKNESATTEDNNDNKKKKNKKQLEREKKEAQKQAELDDYKSKMIAAILTGVNRAFHFATIPDEKVEKHMQVLFRITHTGTFNTAIQALSLIFSVSLAKNTQSDRFYRTLYESMFDPRIMTSSKQAMYLNLLFKAIRADEDQRRVKAFVKRIVQIAGYHQPQFICGLFYILSQLMEKQPALRSMIITPEDNDDEEHFEDAPDEDEEGNNDEETKGKTNNSKPQENLSTYDGRKRDPQFSNADKTCLWELIPFKDHYHPSVVKYAECLFNGEPIRESPDLHHFTLMNFLDRFVYRNPKKQVSTKGSSLMQPLSSRRDGGVLLTRGANNQPDNIPLNSEKFWRMKVDQVPVDEIFFHKYFNQKAKKPTSATKTSKSGDEGEDEENEIWKAMMASVPGGLDDDDIPLDDDEDDEEDDEAMRALLMESDEDEEAAAADGGEDEQDNDDDEDNGLEDMEDFESEIDHVDDIEFLNASSMEEEESDVESQKKRKRSGTSEETSKKKKKKSSQDLPTFASYEDYAALLDKEDDGF